MERMVTALFHSISISPLDRSCTVPVMNSAPCLRIDVVPSKRLAAALELLFAGLAAADRPGHIAKVLSAAAAGDVSLAGLFEALQQGRLTGAIWAELQPGRIASIWPPQLVAGDSRETDECAESLLAAALHYAEAGGARMAQTLLPTDAGASADRLRAAGFRHFADLLYLVSLGDRFPSVPCEGNLEFEPVPHPLDARLAGVVEQTYQGSLDCPALNGVRDIEDVLAGYRAAGTPDRAPWFIVRHGQLDVGCLLLADDPESAQWQLVYMGLIPSARGRGWGLEIIRQAQWLAGRTGRARLVLAVDAANAPAIEVYAAAGFTAWDRRSAFVRVWEPAGRAEGSFSVVP